MKKDRFKAIIGLILMLFGIGLIICAVMTSIIIRWQNIDVMSSNLFVTHLELIAGMIFGLIMTYVGKWLVEK